jgi:hypothetical protein
MDERGEPQVISRQTAHREGEEYTEDGEEHEHHRCEIKLLLPSTSALEWLTWTHDYLRIRRGGVPTYLPLLTCKRSIRVLRRWLG